LINYKYIWKW